jgi:hypothetical protein
MLLETPSKLSAIIRLQVFEYGAPQGSGEDRVNPPPTLSSYSCIWGCSLTQWHPSQMKDDSRHASFDVISVDNDNIKLKEKASPSLFR